MNEIELKKIVNHYCSLYHDELETVSQSSIREWWLLTRDQYSDEADKHYEDIEKAILDEIEKK